MKCSARFRGGLRRPRPAHRAVPEPAAAVARPSRDPKGDRSHWATEIIVRGIRGPVALWPLRQFEREQLCGIKVLTVPSNGHVQVRASDAAGASAESKQLALLHLVAFLHFEF